MLEVLLVWVWAALVMEDFDHGNASVRILLLLAEVESKEEDR